MVKRFRQVDGRWSLISDNLAHLPRPMTADDRIVGGPGSVVWPAQRCSRLTGVTIADRLDRPPPARATPPRWLAAAARPTREDLPRVPTRFVQKYTVRARLEPSGAHEAGFRRPCRRAVRRSSSAAAADGEIRPSGLRRWPVRNYLDRGQG